MQTTSRILLIRPVNFQYNPETAVNNSFQLREEGAAVQQKAEQEFDTFVRILSNEGVEVTVIKDTPDAYTPDSVFPNNWISFHEDGSVFLYPMFAENRRKERKPGILAFIQSHYPVKEIVDLSFYETKGTFLEGTGSMVLDRENRIAYACASPRTHSDLLAEWCKKASYTPHIFHACDARNRDIYHTNVMMCIASGYAVVCLDAVKDAGERRALLKILEETRKEVISITMGQMEQFAGNMLQVHNKAGEKLLVMSTRAYASLSSAQLSLLYRWNRIVHAPLYTIERNGGGSARCMMAEIHLPPAG